jgi:hypothetical protein
MIRFAGGICDCMFVEDGTAADGLDRRRLAADSAALLLILSNVRVLINLYEVINY